jgi:hypothetical protein
MDNQPHTERPAYSTIPPRFEEMDALSADTVLNIAVAILVGWQVRTDPDFYFGIAALPPWWREDAALEAAGDPYRVWQPGDELEELPQEPADEDWLDIPVSVGGKGSTLWTIQTTERVRLEPHPVQPLWKGTALSGASSGWREDPQVALVLAAILARSNDPDLAHLVEYALLRADAEYPPARPD